MADFNFPEINWTDESTSVNENPILKVAFLKILGTVTFTNMIMKILGIEQAKNRTARLHIQQ